MTSEEDLWSSDERFWCMEAEERRVGPCFEILLKTDAIEMKHVT